MKRGGYCVYEHFSGSGSGNDGGVDPKKEEYRSPDPYTPPTRIKNPFNEDETMVLAKILEQLEDLNTRLETIEEHMKPGILLCEEKTKLKWKI